MIRKATAYVRIDDESFAYDGSDPKVVCNSYQHRHVDPTVASCRAWAL